MKALKERNDDGKIKYLFMWLIGIPIPIILLLFLMCG